MKFSKGFWCMMYVCFIIAVIEFLYEYGCRTMERRGHYMPRIGTCRR